jgi:Spy/CpxP family protein refolding chaperone
MKHPRYALAAFTLALFCAPALAGAQEAPPDGPPGAAAPAAAGTPNPERFAEMRETRAQLDAIREQARYQMLAALTTAHRTQLATIVGGLAIAPKPDVATAAKQIDASLSAREARAILTIESNQRTSSRALMESERAKFEATLDPAERAKMEARHHPMGAGPRANRPAPDAGFILLHAALPAEGHREGPPPGR